MGQGLFRPVCGDEGKALFPEDIEIVFYMGAEVSSLYKKQETFKYTAISKIKEWSRKLTCHSLPALASFVDR